LLPLTSLEESNLGRISKSSSPPYRGSAIPSLVGSFLHPSLIVNILSISPVLGAFQDGCKRVAQKKYRYKMEAVMLSFSPVFS
jgi:hypothetical protein